MAVMNKKDAEKIIKDLSEKPFVCTEHYIETDSGYVITTKEKRKYARSKKRTNADQIRNMTDEELVKYLKLIQEHTIKSQNIDSLEDMLQWLQAEVKEGAENE